MESKIMDFDEKFDRISEFYRVFSPSEIRKQIKKNENIFEYLEEIKNCDVVVWDDVYTSSNETHYESQMLYSLINSRIFAKKCNIFTSNMSPDKLESVSERMASRICNNSDCIEITGTDKRGQMLYTNFMNEWKEADSVEVDNDGTDTSTE